MFEIPGYRIARQIHDGRHSVIYQGHRQFDNLAVIIKMLKNKYPSFVDTLRFQQEYMMLRSLGSYGVVRAYALENVGNAPAIIMEDFGGISLDKCVENSKIDLADLLFLFIRIAQALEDVHSQTVIHKDINPTNIVWNRNTGQVKLIDFGISSNDTKERLEFISPDVFEGTLSYMSPEQTGRMNRMVDFRTDLYSLGVTFYELLTNRLPFIAKDSIELVYAHFAKSPKPLNKIKPEIPDTLSDIILKLLAKMAENRYQSASGLRSDLETCLNHLKKDGAIPFFRIGLNDVSDHFQIPQKLYNRGIDIESLLTAYDCISIGEKELVIVQGSEGIGKTLLVKEIQKTVVNRGGYFISGKFERIKQEIPYDPIIQAFRKLVMQLLSYSHDTVAYWKEKLIDRLGANGQIIIDVIPELELIIGKQQPAPELASVESRNRFNIVFNNFVDAFSSKNHPLVIFLDDLQWADLPSLKLIELMMTDQDDNYLLIIGTCVNSHMDDEHPLTRTLSEIRKNNVKINTIQLRPLELIHVKQLLAETLSTDLASVTPLAELCFRKTYGNPLFLNKLLLLMHEEGGIAYNKNERKWSWDIEKLSRAKISDNVIELMIAKFQRLPEETAKTLKLASCIGNRFDLQLLSFLCGSPSSDVFEMLRMPLKEGLIESFIDVNDFQLTSQGEFQGVSYSFPHDRIHQAIYSLVSIEERNKLHLKIGQLLLEGTSKKDRSGRLFDIVTHWNLGHEFVVEHADILQLAELNLHAGRKAKASAAFESAYHYFKSGLNAIKKDGWRQCYDLTHELYVETVELAYLNSEFDHMEELSATVLKEAGSLLGKTKVYEAKILAYIAQNKLMDAIRTSLHALKQLGVMLPEKPNILHIITGLIRTKVLLSGKTNADISNQKRMDDPLKVAAMRILTRMASAAFFSVPQLLPLITFQQIRLTVKFGNTSDSATAFAIYGLIQCGVTGDIDAGFHFGDLSMQLVERLNARELETKTIVIVNSQIRHWKEHARKTLPPLMKAYQIGLETGDLEYAAYAIHIHCCNSYCIGQNLSELLKNIESREDEIRRLNQKTAYNFHLIWHQSVINLLGKSKAPSRLSGNIYDAEKMLPAHQAANDRTSMFDVYLHQIVLAYLFHDYSEAVRKAVLVEKYSDGVTGMLYVPMMYFYVSLARLAVCRTISGVRKKKMLRKVLRDRKRMKKWARHAPDNFLHKYELISAEYARVINDEISARKSYQQAIYNASRHEYINELAIASELFAQFWLERDEKDIARLYMSRARQEYMIWGADGKVKQLDELYPDLLDRSADIHPRLIQGRLTATTSSEYAANHIDTLSVLKASQAISGEIELEELLRKLMNIVFENAGAQRGCLLLKLEDQLYVEAEKLATENGVKLLPSLPIDKADIPKSIIRFVERTHEALFLDNTSESDFFSDDEYVRQNNTKSVLCIPIIHQNKLVSILYAENNLASGVFTRERRETLSVITSQAAVSLENALLYAALKKAEEKWRTLIRTSIEGFIELDNDAYIMDVNPEMCKILGMAKTQIIGRNLLSTVNYLNADIFKRELALRKEGKRSTYEITFQRPDNSEVHCLVKATPLFDGMSQIGSFAMVTDITDRKLAEEEIRRLNDELEHRVKQRTAELERSLETLKKTQKHLVESEKMVSLGRLVAGVAHEVNTPLGVAVTAASYLDEKTQNISNLFKDETISRDTVEKYLVTAKEASDLILSNLKRASDLIRSFKQVAVDQSAEEKRKFNVKQYIDELLLSVRPKYKKTQHAISVQCPEKLEITSYPGALAQILTNLIMNSLIHGFDEIDAGHISIDISADDNQIRMIYQDNGKGMDPDTLQKVFEPFFTTKRSHGGTGLGMHLVYNLVTQTMGGMIECESRKGKGVEFKINFPFSN